MSDPGSSVEQNVSGSGHIFSGTGPVTVTQITEDKTYDVAGLPNPYLGLRSFTYAERFRFGGRDHSIDETLAKLTAPGEPRVLLFITGASGSGKSSFAQAGLLPALEAYYAQRGQQVRHAVFRPGAHPLAARDDALQQMSVGTEANPSRLISVLIIDQFEELFGQSPPVERDPLINWVAELPPFVQRPQHVLVTLRSDYLNELFEIKPLWEAAKLGVELRAMRADELKDAILRPLQSQYPKEDQRFEPALLERLAQDAAGEATYLPLLQVTLDELWKKGRLVLSNYSTLSDAIRQRANQVFEFADYDGADPKRHRTTGEQAAILDLFLSLVNVSPDDDARRDVRISRAIAVLTPDQRRLAEDLSRARLLSVEGEPNVETVNIIHETLIRNWDKLGAAVTAKRQQLRRRGRFEQQLQLWLGNNRSGDYLLLTSVQLAEAHELNSVSDIALRNQDAQELLRLSNEHVEAQHERELEEARRLAESESRRAEEAQKLVQSETQRAEEQAQANRRMQARNRIITAVGTLAGTAAVIAIALWVLANNSRIIAQDAQATSVSNAATARAAQVTSVSNAAFAQAAEATSVSNAATAQAAGGQAVQQRDEAQRQARLSKARELAAAAVSNLSADPERSILLALQALNTTYVLDNKMVVPEAEEALHRAIQNSPVRLNLTGHTDAVLAVAFSPDGTRLATASQDNTAKVWDATTGQALLTLSGAGGNTIAFSPDGTRLATGSQDNTAKVWDATTGKVLLTLTGHSDAVNSVAFSPDGQRLATASWDKTAIVWNPTTGQRLLTLSGHTNAVMGIVFSPDGTRLATASQDNTAKVWDATTGKELLTLTGHADYVNAIAFSPDGTRVATGSLDNTAKVWDATTGKELLTLTGHTPPLFGQMVGGILGIAFSPDGERLATASSDNTTKLWDATTGSELFTLIGHSDVVFSVAFSPDGHRVATASLDKTAKVWDVTTRNELITLTGHTADIVGIAFSPDSQRLASASFDGTARVWDVTTGKELLKLTGPNTSTWVIGIAFSPDGQRLATASAYTATLWNVTTGKELLTLTDAHGIYGIAFSPNGKRLATASFDDTAKVWDATTGTELFALTSRPPDPVHGMMQIYEFDRIAMAFSPDGMRLATAASSDNNATIWDATTGKELFALTGHPRDVLGIAFSPDGTRLATTSADNTAKIWDATTGKELLALIGHTAPVYGVAFSPDGKRLATTSRDNTTKVWDATSGQELFTLTGHTAPVYGIAFSPDGKYLATASADGTVRVYASSIEELIALGHTRLVRTWTLDECRKYLQLDTCPPEP